MEERTCNPCYCAGSGYDPEWLKFVGHPMTTTEEIISRDIQEMFCHCVLGPCRAYWDKNYMKYKDMYNGFKDWYQCWLSDAIINRDLLEAIPDKDLPKSDQGLDYY